MDRFGRDAVRALLALINDRSEASYDARVSATNPRKLNSINNKAKTIAIVPTRNRIKIANLRRTTIIIAY